MLPYGLNMTCPIAYFFVTAIRSALNILIILLELTFKAFVFHAIFTFIDPNVHIYDGIIYSYTHPRAYSIPNHDSKNILY